MTLEDVPKKVQYVILDSRFVNGTNNVFSLDLTLKSNTHVEDMSRVIGIKMVDFYITQVGENDTNLNTNIAKYVDVICPDVPKVAQMLDERNGQILARVPLERHFVLEITTINVKEKSPNKEVQILEVMNKLLQKIDTLNTNVQKLPDKPPDENPKKYSFGLLIVILMSLFGGFIWWVNKTTVS